VRTSLCSSFRLPRPFPCRLGEHYPVPLATPNRPPNAIALPLPVVPTRQKRPMTFRSGSDTECTSGAGATGVSGVTTTGNPAVAAGRSAARRAGRKRAGRRGTTQARTGDERCSVEESSTAGRSCTAPKTRDVESRRRGSNPVRNRISPRCSWSLPSGTSPGRWRRSGRAEGRGRRGRSAGPGRRGVRRPDHDRPRRG
jgi:hypothetical protein